MSNYDEWKTNDSHAEAESARLDAIEYWISEGRTPEEAENIVDNPDPDPEI